MKRSRLVDGANNQYTQEIKDCLKTREALDCAKDFEIHISVVFRYGTRGNMCE